MSNRDSRERITAFLFSLFVWATVLSSVVAGINRDGETLAIALMCALIMAALGYRLACIWREP